MATHASRTKSAPPATVGGKQAGAGWWRRRWWAIRDFAGAEGDATFLWTRWLVLRGVKTLAVRMKQHDLNGRVVADFLDSHPKVKKVFYPGLAHHPQYDLAYRQMSGFGSMITFETGPIRPPSEAQSILLRITQIGRAHV